MGVFQRMKDMTRASLNEMLDKVEDPIVMLNQYLRDMEQEISQAELSVATQIGNERKILHRLQEADRLMKDRESQAETALKNGQESLARTAIQEKLFYAGRLKEYETMHAEAKNQAEELKRQLQGMKEEYYRMKERRNELVQRAQLARAKKQMSRTVFQHASIEGGGASRGFQRMEERIIEMEVEADTLRQPYTSATGSPAAPESAIRNEAVEAELAKLKEKVSE